MKLASFVHQGRNSFGIVEGDSIFDLGQGDEAGSELRSVLTELLDADPEILSRSRPAIPLNEINFRPPIVDGQKILCVGLNYRKHVEEAGLDIPKHPGIFVRFPDSVVGHDDAIIKPEASIEFDFEGELAVIIGRRGRNIPAAEALRFVGGYSCFADNSIRDFQRHAAQATPGKNFPASGGFGPWLVTANEVGDPTRLNLTTRLNGEIVQASPLSDLIFSIPELIAYISSWTELFPGDVIATGTPGGVGAARKPPLWMVPGDILEVEISRVGTLRQEVVAESRTV